MKEEYLFILKTPLLMIGYLTVTLNQAVWKQYTEVIIMRDSNCDDLPYQDKSSIVAKLRAFYKQYQLKQLIRKAAGTTNGSSTLLDHLATNKPNNIASSSSRTIGFSDHIWYAQNFSTLLDHLATNKPNNIASSSSRTIGFSDLSVQSTFVLRIPQGTIMKIRSMQTCIMSSLPRCIFRCSVFRYVTLDNFFKLCYLIVISFTLVANKYLLTYLLEPFRQNLEIVFTKYCYFCCLILIDEWAGPKWSNFIFRK